MEQAAYWARVNAHRWMQALALEDASGDAICDSDPLKLHYGGFWPLWGWNRLPDSSTSSPQFGRCLHSVDSDSQIGRVIHGFPTEGDIATPAQPRPNRYDLNLLDRLLDELPTVAH
jgi:hypothetical protein